MRLRLKEVGIHSGTGKGYTWSREVLEGEQCYDVSYEFAGLRLPALIIDNPRRKVRLVVPWHAIEYMVFRSQEDIQEEVEE